MSHLDLEQGTIHFYDDDDDYVSWFRSNTFGYYSDNDNNDEESSVSKSEGSVCRICKSEVGLYGQGLIELGCSCKDDLASAHRQCAVTWFILKGDEVCEICHSVARNVASGNEMLEEEEVVTMVEDGGGGGGDAAVGEDEKSWWQRHFVLIIAVLCWVIPFLMFFLIRIRI